MDKIRPYIKLDLEIAKMEIENKQVEACFGRYIAYKENLQRINKNNPLPRGQFYLTTRSVYEDLHLSSTREASRLIKLFENHGIIRAVFKSNSRKEPSIYSYITAETVNETVNETDSETVEALENNNLSSHVETVIETVNETEVETSKKEYIKINNKNKYIYMSDSNEYRLAAYLFKFIKRNNSKAKEPNMQKWAKQFDYILRIDKRGIEEAKRLIAWCQNNNFWFKVILSPEKFRKHYDRLLMEIEKPNVNNANDNIEDLKNF